MKELVIRIALEIILEFEGIDDPFEFAPFCPEEMCNSAIALVFTTIDVMQPLHISIC